MSTPERSTQKLTGQYKWAAVAVARKSRPTPPNLTIPILHVLLLFVPTPADIEIEELSLMRLAALGMRIAEAVADRVDMAETPAEAAGLAMAFDRVARSVRMTFALRSRLERDRARLRREARADFADAAQVRKKQVRAAIAARLPASPERPYQLVDLDDRLEVEALDAEFLDGPVEACVARIRRLLGLPGEEAAEACEPLAPSVTPSSGRDTSPVLCGTGEELTSHAPPPKGTLRGRGTAEGGGAGARPQPP